MTTPLHLAALSGWVECVDVLISHDHPVDCRDAQGWPPLLYAHFQNHHECVLALMRAQPKQVCECNGNFKFLLNKLSYTVHVHVHVHVHDTARKLWFLTSSSITELTLYIIMGWANVTRELTGKRR